MGQGSAGSNLSRTILLATLELKLYNFMQALERRYAPDQPRVPAGNPDGGQWTGGGGVSVGSDRSRGGGATQNIVERVASASSQMGRLVAKLPYNVHHVTCIYDFGDALYGFESNMFDGCPGWIPQAVVVPFAGGSGFRLNDVTR